MNATIHTATVLHQHRAARLARETELLRRQAEHTATERPTGFATVARRLRTLVHPVRTRDARVAAAH